ncbi:1-(5-phosphoribosyl)-5-[(5-phosphoribosylamino)methylideneamino]imidazole-4-carboxamide isomerase [bacterium]|nr:1-(5-phosphoribosyl)-5-[(5-phosphoribosylamino)methylideneamino]imidazole-4-carboxamide isomerase [bacterium]
MLIIPAIDLIQGECVRLYQGKEEEKTVFSTDPLNVAFKWQSMGAKLLHLVDLDGAFKGNPQNILTILHMAKRLDMPVELGGGLRNPEIINQILAGGVDRVVLGTIAYIQPELVKDLCQRYPGRIVIGVDARDGMVAIKGWKDTTRIAADKFCMQWAGTGVRAIIYTDIKRDGTLRGPNIWAVSQLLDKIDIPVIASGGISKMYDLECLARLEEKGLEGVIVGRALYTGAICLDEAISKWQNKECPKSQGRG